MSVDSSGNEGNGFSYWPSISSDGRYVALSSSASNLVSGDTSGEWYVFVTASPLYVPPTTAVTVTIPHDD